MALNINSGLTNVTGTVTSAVETKRPNIFLTAEQKTNSTTTLGTVPANKTWTILSYTLNSESVAAANPKVTLKANVQPIAFLSSQTGATTAVTNAVAGVFPYRQAPQITAGQTVTLVVSATGYGSGSITAIEEDA